MESPLERLASAAPGILALAGAILYAYAWAAHVGFYGQFDLAPTDAGLGYATVVTQAGIALALISAAVAIVGLLGVLLWQLAKPLAIVVTTVVFIGAGAVGLTLGDLQVRLLVWITLLALVAGAILVVIGLNTANRSRLLAAIACIAVLVSLGMLIAHTTGSKVAIGLLLRGEASARQGRELPSLVPSNLLHFAQWRVQSVDVQVEKDNAPLRQGTELEDTTGVGFYHLGTANGMFVMWDICLEQITLLPSGSVRVSHRDQPRVIQERERARAGDPDTRGGGGLFCGDGGKF